MSVLQQQTVKDELENLSLTGYSNLDLRTCNGNISSSSFLNNTQNCDEVLSSMIPERDHSDHIPENKLQLQHHEREQHLHQLQSMNNMLLATPTSTLATPSSSYGSSKFSSPELSSPTPTKSSLSFDDLSVSGLIGLESLKNFEFPHGSSLVDIINGHKKQVQSSYESINSYRNFNQHQDNSSGYFSNTSNMEHQDGFYSTLSNMDVPSSPSSVNTHATPSTPGSTYSSNPYTPYSSVNSSPYTSNSSVSNGYTKQYARSPLRSPCYGRPIRGSPPYSDCSSPSAEYPSHTFGSNGSRSDSPADSENSSNGIGCDSSISDIMGLLSLNVGQHSRSHQSNQSTISEAEKYFQNNKATVEGLQKLKKYLYNSHQQQQQQQQQQQHQQSSQIQSPMNQYHHYHNHSHSRTPTFHQQHNNHYNNAVTDKCCLGNPRSLSFGPSTPMSLDKAARYHRNAAAASDANFTWSGTLPQRTQKPMGYSSKVFLGGLPWDSTDAILISTFKQFGQIKVEWPGKDQATSQPKGYAYIIFESEKQVKTLLANCTHDFTNGGSYYYKISSKRMKGKEVQVIPWAHDDSNYVKSSSQKLDASKTVFVGALHGMMTATGIAQIMNDLFDNVTYVGIDTCKRKYPIGSCRVTFSSRQSYLKAIKAAFIEVKTPKFNKKIQCDPYLEEAPCSSCYVQQGPYFCRDMSCFKYYCHTCWQWAHNNENMNWHKPMSRGLKNSHVIGLTPSPGAVRPSNLLS